MGKRKKPDQTEAEKARAENELQKRKFVKTLAGLKMPFDQIGLLLVPSISGQQVQQDYAQEIERGIAEKNLQVMGQFHKNLEKGNMAAIRWWTEAVMGWSPKGIKEPLDDKTEGTEGHETTMPSSLSLEATILGFPPKRSQGS